MTGDRGAAGAPRERIGELTHTFEGLGDVEIGCHEPGHYEASMKIDVTVT